jgi:hypothetical protein
MPYNKHYFKNSFDSISSHIANEHHSFVHVPQSQTGELAMTAYTQGPCTATPICWSKGPSGVEHASRTGAITAVVPSSGTTGGRQHHRTAIDAKFRAKAPGSSLHREQSSPFAPATPPLPAARGNDRPRIDDGGPLPTGATPGVRVPRHVWCRRRRDWTAAGKERTTGRLGIGRMANTLLLLGSMLMKDAAQTEAYVSQLRLEQAETKGWTR